MEVFINSDQSQAISLKKSRFTKMLIEKNEKNGLDQRGFEGWIFCQGMLFNIYTSASGSHPILSLTRGLSGIQLEHPK